MPRIPTYFASVERQVLEAPRGNAAQLADTGQGIDAQTIGNLGRNIFGISQNIHAMNQRTEQLEGGSQFDTSRRQARERYNSFLNEARESRDPSQYDAMYQQALGDIRSLTPENRIGARSYQSWLDSTTPAWDQGVADAKFEGQKLESTAAYFNNIGNLGTYDTPEGAEAELRSLTEGAVDDGLRTPAQAQADFDNGMAKWETDDVWRTATISQRPDGEVDWAATVEWFSQPENIEGLDPDTISSLTSKASTQMNLQKARDADALFESQEASRDEISKLMIANDPTVLETIENSSLDETEQQTWRQRVNAETARISKGEVILTNQKDRADLNTMALDIWRGAVTKKDFDSAVNDARYGENPTIDDAAYKELTNSAASTLKTSQAEALSRADTEASRLFVDFKEDDAFARFVSDSIKGLQPDAASLFESKANETRAQQFWLLSQYNQELRTWLADNPDKVGKDFYQHSQQLKYQYWDTKKTGNLGELVDFERSIINPNIKGTSPSRAALFPNAGASATIEPPAPTTQEEYDAIPKGTEFKDTDGKIKVKQ